MSKTVKERTAIPKDTRRRLLIEAGYCCSMPGCTEGSALDFHHIDGDRNNHEFNNLLVLCSNHHRIATRGHIDKKACRIIKKNLSSQDYMSSSTNAIMQTMRKLLRNELKAAGLKHPTKISASVSKRSIFNRKYLFHVLKTLAAPTRDIYLSIRILGELQYRGSTDLIISALQKLYNKTPKKKKEKFYFEFYFPALDSLSRIGTRKALHWMAREFLDDQSDPLKSFILFMTIAENEKAAQKHIGFRRLSRTTMRKANKKTVRDVYTICNRRLEVLSDNREIRFLLPPG